MSNVSVPANATPLSFASSRRRFLGSMAAGLMPSAALAAVTPIAQPVPPPGPEERLETAIAELVAAMTAIHGDGVQLVRNERRCICVLEPTRPRIVEFAGDGFYEVEEGKRRPIYRVERAAAFDCPNEGRCFRLTLKGARKRSGQYSYEPFLRTVLIRKI